tara:strand:- start:4343 stop:7243 length:2901 start_codon:yes stop_codon:yes gene_type:complete
MFPDGTDRFYNPVPIAPSETLQDPVGKLRVSNPQALIDTDFEYSTQSTKWESLNLLNNRPSAFYDVTAPLVITAIAGAGTRVVTVTTTTPPAVGTPVFIQDTTNPLANGWFLVDTVSAGVSFTYIATNTIPAASIYDVTKTYVFSGTFYTGAGIPLTGTTAFTFSGTTITCTTTNAHGLTIGDAIYVVGTTGGTPAPNGAWIVQTTPTSNTFTFVVITAPTVAIANTAGATNLYVRPYGSIIHRSFDGGVAFSAGYPYSGNQLIRQTRRYFRYQSGKGIQFSTGTCVKPAFNVDSITSSGTTVTVTLKNPHNLNGNFAASTGITVSASAGAAFTNSSSFNNGLTVTCTTTNNHGFIPGDTVVVRGTTSTTNPPNGTWVINNVLNTTTFQFNVSTAPTGAITASAGATSTLYPQPGGPFVVVSGCNETAYNGTFLVQTVPTDLSFTYTATAIPSATPATGFPLNVNPTSWYGSRSRIGLFDEQNGFFFEFDGQVLYAVKRSSTAQISGTIAVTSGSSSVTGTNTLFSKQLNPGDYIVIRGMTYIVQSITSDTGLIIYPEYRSPTNISNCTVSKRIEERYPQSQWNIDRCDGNGPSGLNLDLTKMQMLYIDYSWYGAGAIRFGFKDQKGEVFYCHRIPNSNRNTEAYMRSGNICSRYETNTLPVFTNLASSLANTEVNTLTVASTAGFPQSGVLAVTASGNTGAAIEYIRYNSKTSTTFTGLRRAIVDVSGSGNLSGGGGNATAQTFTYSATAPIQVALYSSQATATLSHWGSAVIMDGRYDDDKSYIFQAGTNTAFTNIAASGSVALLSVRLAPSVDSGLTGVLGARDLINRMQLTLRQMDVVATGSAAIFRVELILNGRVSAGSFIPAGGSSLAQISIHSAGTTVTGGESIFSFFVYTPNVTQQDLSLVRDLGNSILGGGTNLTVPTTASNLYPDGPDVVTVKVTNVSAQATNSIQARISWTEAQA